MRRSVPKPHDDAFARHRVDPGQPGALEQIASRLRATGLVTFTGATTRTQVLELASRVMDIAEHRDSDSDGLTTIRDTRHHAHRPGFAGFGSGPLEPHTERSGTPCPPRLMMLVCGQAATSGGRCLLVDGRTVHADLISSSNKAATTLTQSCTAYFGAGDGNPTQVFTVHADQHVSVRLRLDELARFSPVVQPYLPELRAAIQRHQVLVSLAPGDGYLLDNRRWLHARTAFTGERVCWRALGHPRFPMPQGFAPAPVTASALVSSG
ncbi:TauD/TfdA family dioxygenase [Streptomyces sp. DB-54]